LLLTAEAGASETVELKRGMVLGTDTEHKKGEEIYISYSMYAIMQLS